jgi:hypothetical protein
VPSITEKRYTVSKPVLAEDLNANKLGGLTFDTLIPYHTSTDYWGLDVNQSISDASWDVLDTNPMAISLHDNYAKKVGLGPSTRFPWDTERSIYYLKGFHDLHCLVRYVASSMILKLNMFAEAYS